MSKISKALEKLEQDRRTQKEDISSIRARSYGNALRYTRKGSLKNSWLISFFIVGVIAIVYMAFRHQADNKIPFSEIFPEEDKYPVDIEYEFVDAPVVTLPTEATGSSLESVAVDQQHKQVTPTGTMVEQVVPPATIAKTVEPPQDVQQVASAKAEQEIKQEQVSLPDILNQSPQVYAIQIASFKKIERAKELLRELIQKDYDAYVVQKDLGSKGVWYRIYVGKFQTKDSADQALTDVKKNYKSSFVIAPKKK
ncbi:MAG: SPOR domain-containing protein [Candidatus Omnitrophica bacterium]|nr:SPOR domain-containing protein [Candidatus Omnitrophota bacterium]